MNDDVFEETGHGRAPTSPLRRVLGTAWQGLILTGLASWVIPQSEPTERLLAHPADRTDRLA